MQFRYAALSVAAALCLDAYGADQQIEVDTEVQELGSLGLKLHMNLSRPGPGATEPDRRVFNVSPELAYGFARNWEVTVGTGARRVGDHLTANGGRTKLQYVSRNGNDARGFYWGGGAEVGYLTNLPDEHGWVTEIAPIAGFRAKSWHVAMNARMPKRFSGPERKLELDPAATALIKLNEKYEVGVEYYAKLGPIRNFLPSDEQEHTLFGVVNFEIAGVDVNFGVGRGITDASDRWVVKTILEFKLK